MRSDAELDIIIYGATGYTGQLVAQYFMQRYGDSMAWGLAGRSLEKLEKVRAAIAAPSSLPLIVAKAESEDSLKSMVHRTKCVVTTVGPYQLYGAPLVEACARAGTDYVDLCGEPGWMHDMIGRYGKEAETTGARIVFSCGFDSIPFDLGVQFLQTTANSTWGHAAPRVHARVRTMEGKFSGGTAASLKATVAALAKNRDLMKVLGNPFALTMGFQGPAQPDDTKPKEDPLLGVWLTPFVMAPINTKNVHRSNALLNFAYGKDFMYDEMMVTGSGEQGKQIAMQLASVNPLAGDDVPKPGEGPTEQEREAGHYDILFVGQNAQGDIVKVAVTGDKDPGYGSTSKMIAESAVCLVTECHDTPGGISTPAASMGPRLMARLIANAGLTFEVEN